MVRYEFASLCFVTEDLNHILFQN